MYKINVNVSELFLIDESERHNFNETDSTILFINYHGKSNSLTNYIDLLEKSLVPKKVVIISNDYEKLKNDFKDLFSIVKAAGGVVLNNKQEILFIFRRGFWDFPKGKLEKGETKREAAIREVEEETGASNLIIIKKLSNTKHFYRSKDGRRMIKKSYWYLMLTTDQPLNPQLDEDIEQAEWYTRLAFDESDKVLYPSLVELYTSI